MHSAIIEFITRLQGQSLDPEQVEQLSRLRQASRNIVEAVKGLKHLHKNLSRNLLTGGPDMRNQYDGIRIELGTVLRDLNIILEQESDAILSIDEVALDLRENDEKLDRALDELIRNGALSPTQATSLMNDNAYARDIAENLLQMGRVLFGTRSAELKDAQEQVSLEDSELEEIMNRVALARGDTIRRDRP